MRNYQLLIILTTISFCTFGQNSKTDTDKIVKYFEWTDKIEYLKSPEYNQSILSGFEKNRDTIFLRNFLSTYYDSVKLYDEFPYLPNDLVKYIYAIDLNGDNLLDIFYQGPTGGEQNITQIYLNHKGSFRKVFKGYQDIVDIKFNKNRLVSFKLYNPGCCADPQTVEYNYEITYKKDEPKFSLIKTVGYFYPTEKPKNSFNPVQDFSITVGKSKLRKECYFLDTVEHPITGGEGNIIATYKKNAIGKAIGFKKDGEIEWIYVLMVTPDKIEKCEFSTFLEHPTEIYGWILKTDTDLK
jgi:hypothetical protein